MLIATPLAIPRESLHLFRLLVEAAPHPLTYADMRGRGIESPAQALYELQLAGHTVTRVFGRDEQNRRTMLGYRLD